MSRCTACNTPIGVSDAPIINKYTHQEEDLCTTCRHLVYNSYVEPEYTCGRYPQTGITIPSRLSDNN